MALSKHEPRRFRRPADGEEDVQVALVPGMSRAARRAAVATAKPEISKPDPARQALLDVIALRGKPIQRKRGMVPSLRFQRAAGDYIKRHHYTFCVQFARGRSARHIPLSDMIQAQPELAPVLGPMWAKLKDMPEADKISRLLLAMAPPQVQQLENGDESAQIPPQVQAKLQAAEQQSQQMQQMMAQQSRVSLR